MSRSLTIAVQLALILLVALALRLAVAAWWQSRLPDDARFGFGDSESYWQLGWSIAAGTPYRYGAGDAQVFRSPGYPLLLAGLFRVAGIELPVMWARAQSAVLSTMAVGGVFWLAQQLFNARTGLLAALVAAFYPGAVAIGALVLSEAPFCTLMLLQLLLWQAGWRASTPRASAAWLLAAGLTAGAATLVRPEWLLFTPFAILVGLAFSGERRKHALAGVWLLVGLGLAMAPWWIRNAQVTGHFVPTTLQVGASLYDGWNPQATGGSNLDFVAAAAERLRAADRRAATPPTDSFEYRLDRVLWREAVEWATANPSRALQLAGVKLTRMWNVWPNEPQFRRPLVGGVVAASYVPVLVLGLIGARKYGRRGWPYVLCVLPGGYLTLLHVVFVSSIRYRQPAMLTLIVLAAAVVVERIRPDAT